VAQISSAFFDERGRKLASQGVRALE